MEELPMHPDYENFLFWRLIARLAKAFDILNKLS
jgi:hypothetical protein